MTTFVTADTHLHHDRMCHLAHRPYANGDAMDADLIRRWNATVQDGDLVYHLGDFAFSKAGHHARETWDHLKGNKVLIAGNHDGANGTLSKLRSAVMDYGGMRWGLVHDPDFAGTVGECDYVLCGHVHTAWRHVWRHRDFWVVRSDGVTADRAWRWQLVLNVGVDVVGFQPVSMETVLRLARRITEKQHTDEQRAAHNASLGTDHHGREWGKIST